MITHVTGPGRAEVERQSTSGGGSKGFYQREVLSMLERVRDLLQKANHHRQVPRTSTQGINRNNGSVGTPKLRRGYLELVAESSWILRITRFQVLPGSSVGHLSTSGEGSIISFECKVRMYIIQRDGSVNLLYGT